MLPHPRRSHHPAHPTCPDCMCDRYVQPEEERAAIRDCRRELECATAAARGEITPTTAQQAARFRRAADQFAAALCVRPETTEAPTSTTDAQPR